MGRLEAACNEQPRFGRGDRRNRSGDDVGARTRLISSRRAAAARPERDEKDGDGGDGEESRVQEEEGARARQEARMPDQTLRPHDRNG